jgi:hypothetical protein
LVLWVFLGFELLRLLVRERERERCFVLSVCLWSLSVEKEREKRWGLKGRIN